jgi:hypothetical protein
LRELNKVVKLKVYPLPIITDILRKCKGYEFFSKLDISMQYYTFELDEESQDVKTCVQLLLDLANTKDLRLPMGLKCSSDIAQSVMENILCGIEDIECYIDGIGAFSNDWTSHKELLDSVLQRLRGNGFTINPLKCEWAVKETDWLGYWLTPRGLKPFGVRKLMSFCIWIIPVHPKNCVGSLAVSTTTAICGPVEHMFSNP